MNIFTHPTILSRGKPRGIDPKGIKKPHSFELRLVALSGIKAVNIAARSNENQH
jgi:hypothetical protein